MQGILEQVLQAVFLIAVVGFIFAVLYQILKAISSFFLIGVIGGLAFLEVYGTFTKRYLFTEDLATNGMWSFTSFYLVFNLLIVLGIVTKVIRSKVAKMTGLSYW